MKKVFRNEIWMMIIAWCMTLNGFRAMGLAMTILSTLYIGLKVRKMNYWRCIFNFEISTALLLMLIYKTNFIMETLSFIPFISLMSLDASMLNEMLYKIKISTVVPYYFVISLTMVVFIGTAAIIPDLAILPDYKRNLFIYIVLIFVPIFLYMSYALTLKILKSSKRIEHPKKNFVS